MNIDPAVLAEIIADFRAIREFSGMSVITPLRIKIGGGA